MQRSEFGQEYETCIPASVWKGLTEKSRNKSELKIRYLSWNIAISSSASSVLKIFISKNNKRQDKRTVWIKRVYLSFLKILI